MFCQKCGKEYSGGVCPNCGNNSFHPQKMVHDANQCKFPFSYDAENDNVESNDAINTSQFEELIEKIKRDDYYNWQKQRGITETSELFEPYEDWKERNKLGIKYISDDVTAPQHIKSLDGKRIVTVGGLKLITNFKKLAENIHAIYNRKLIPDETDIIVSSNIYYDDFIEGRDSDTWRNLKVNYPNILIIRESEFLKKLGFKVPKSECKGENTMEKPVNYNVREKGKNIISFPDDYVMIDIETTGLSTDWDSIIEVAAVKVHNGEIINEYSSFVEYNDELPEFITDLTGITNEMLIGAPSPQIVMKELSDFIGSDIIIGYNINLLF
jgi:DNA polymerase III